LGGNGSKMGYFFSGDTDFGGLFGYWVILIGRVLIWRRD
jgi:hypothetical protein